MDATQPRWTALVVGGSFLTLTAWFLLGSQRPEFAIPPAASVPAAAIAPVPLRQAQWDPPTIRLAGFVRDCQDCHQIFKASRTPERPLYQHLNIELSHGKALGDICLSCHYSEDRNRLVIHGDVTVPFAQVAQLCGKCHGLVYSDWERGMHGRTQGSWDAGSGNQRRLVCTECHDPHRPRYDRFEPLRGPRTLRMGHQPAEPEHHFESPLMRRTP